ncbi:MAG: prepilin peptidase [Clostridiaceae bacterium]|nr:prepilin peptidase [Clostridiaceae bacterium]
MPADAAVRSVWFFCTLALASAADLRRHLIPNTFCILTAVAGLIAISPARFVGQILGPLAALPFLGVAMIFPDRAGGGDIKFVASVGFVLGLLPTLWGAYHSPSSMLPHGPALKSTALPHQHQSAKLPSPWLPFFPLVLPFSMFWRL